jgi:hypothetical protein
MLPKMNTSSEKPNSWISPMKNSLPPTSDTFLLNLPNSNKMNTTPPTDKPSTGLIRELLPLLRIKDNAVHVGLSQSPETLKDIPI